MDGGQVVSVVEVDPELACGLDAESRELARRQALVRLARLERGPWQPQESNWGARAFALLVVEGQLLHEVSMAGRQAAELLGAGDVLRAVASEDDYQTWPVASRWRVCEPALVAVLDQRFAALAGRQPALVEALLERATRRSNRLAVQLTITCLTRVDERLLLVLWQLAERWGCVRPTGVRLPLALTHDTLGRLVGAHRPSVTEALGHLRRMGMIERVPGGWALFGDPQDQLARLNRRRDVAAQVAG